ncbi:membrane protein [Salmonella enterica subsp. arizonae]|uniref:Membrane protein n=1 Tax=Salmonella enterica subsp. arizonae TaxID=59203 RepID=A0A447RBA2_SALER|nr:membrane protein [Salmonella enterica subsp. arizonae]
MNSFIEGARQPLLSVWRRALLFSGALLLTACSHNASPPPFTASGFAGDQGAVRIWRKDTNDEVHLLSVFSPWHSGSTRTSEYRWQGDTLSLIELNIYSKPPEHIRARVSTLVANSVLCSVKSGAEAAAFQRSDCPVSLSRRTKSVRPAMHCVWGAFILRQGRWHADHTVTTCEGETLKPDLDSLGNKPH